MFTSMLLSELRIISAPIGLWEVKLENMSDRTTDRRAHREVSLPISSQSNR